jgi:hypothetical protein
MNPLLLGWAALALVAAADAPAEPANAPADISASSTGAFAPAPPPAKPDAPYDPLLSKLDVNNDVKPRKATLGAEIVWTTTVQHPEGSIGFAAPYTGGTLTVKSSDVHVVSPGKSEAKIVLTGLDLGKTTLLPLELRYTAPDGSDHPFQVLGGQVEIVATTQADPNAKRADLAPPVPILRWNPFFFGARAALLLAVAGYLYWRSRPKPIPPPPAPPVDPRTPAQIALDAIFQLQTSGMLERREIKPFTYVLDDIVRQFLIQTLKCGELAETTDEFLNSIRPATLDDRMARIEAFFRQGDRVRFAGEEHEIGEAKGLCETAIELVTLLSGHTPASPASPASSAAPTSGSGA